MEGRLVKGKSLCDTRRGKAGVSSRWVGLISKGLSGWGALTARRSRPFRARREDTLLCTHSRTPVHARTRTRDARGIG